MPNRATIAVFPGDGIGPEVTAEAVAVLEAVAPRHGLALAFSSGTIGGAAIDATGELYPVETETRLLSAFRTNEEAVIDLDAATITNVDSGAVHPLRPLGDAGPVIAEGGLFAYARKTGMIAAATSAATADPGQSAGPED